MTTLPDDTEPSAEALARDLLAQLALLIRNPVDRSRMLYKPGTEFDLDDTEALKITTAALDRFRAAGMREGIERCAKRHDAWAAKAAVRANDAMRRGNNLQHGFDLTEVRAHEASAADLRADARALLTEPPHDL